MDSRFAKVVSQKQPKSIAPVGEGKSGACLAKYDNGFKAIVKFRKPHLPNGRETQRDIRFDTHPDREVAFYKLAQLFGWSELVPETLFVKIDGAEASAQMYMPAVPLDEIDATLAKPGPEHEEEWLTALKKVCRKAPRADWVRLTVLDLVAGQRDRHANNVGLLLDLDGERPRFRVVGWDNACTFGLTFSRYHNVFHKFLFRRAVNIEPFWDHLQGLLRADFEDALGQYLTALEVEHAYQRLQWLLEYPYKLPWRFMSGGQADDFPSYEEWFVPLYAPELSDGFVVAV